LLYSCIYTLIATLGFGILFNIKGKNLVFASIGGGVSWFFYLLTYSNLHFANLIAFFIASVIGSVYSEVMARILKTPVTTFIICTIIPLVPGGGMYYTMFSSIQGNVNESLNLGLQTLSIAGTVAIGVFLVSSITKAIVFFARKLKTKVVKI
jgi:uncharacterized membrane protein YjjB (DUF3815 family)